MKTVKIGKKVKSIETLAFHNCNNMRGVYISDVSAWCNIEFDSNTSNPLYYADNLYLNDVLVTDLIIPDDVTVLKSRRFHSCTSLVSVIMGDNVEIVEEAVFSQCHNLKNVTISNSVISLGTSAFAECFNLESITIGSGLKNIEKWVFTTCSSLKKVYYAGSAEEWNEITVADGNEDFLSSTIFYYSELEPAEGGNYWRYDENGNAVEW